MIYMFGKDIQFKIERLTADTRNFVGSFSCGNLEINDYINNEEAFYDCETVTYLLLEKDDNDQFTKLIGFLSLSCSAIIKDLDSVDSDGRPYDELVPAALIEYLLLRKNIMVSSMVYSRLIAAISNEIIAMFNSNTGDTSLCILFRMRNFYGIVPLSANLL